MINLFHLPSGKPCAANAGRLGVYLALAAIGLTTWSTSGADAQGREQWERLGCVEVGRRPDRDIITIGRREGRFRALRLEVTGNDVNIDDMRVVYGNGQPDDIALRSEFREGTSSRAIDLKGRDRAIDRIELVSRRGYQGRGRGRGQICVSGLQVEQRRGRPIAPVAQWEELGCQKVGFFNDRDSINVGRREGRFRAIRLRVTGNDVHMERLVVVYGNGSPDEIPVSFNIRQGDQSGPLDLKGRERAIHRIDMLYRARKAFKGSARVCVDGLQNIR
jgi:hypothetical protein